MFGIWDGIVTSSVCPQAEYPINEWSSLTPVNSPHPLPQSALNQQSSSSSCLSSQRTERTDFGFVGKAGNQPLPHLQPAAFAARPDLGIEAGLDCISYAHFSPLLCIIQLHFLTVLHNCISVLDCISYGHFSKMPSHRTVTRSRHLPIFNFTPTPPPPL